MRLWIVGNSHVNALNRAHRELGPALASPFSEIRAFPIATARAELGPFSRVDGDAVEFTAPDVREKFQTRSGLDRIAGDDVWAISMGLHNVTLLREPFWDTNAPSHIATGAEAPVSRRLCGEIIEAAQAHARRFLLHLREAGIRTLVVSSPPLRRDHPAFGARRLEVTLEVDRMARAAMTEFLAENDITFVDFPEESRAADGFLREDLHAPDRPDGTRDTHHGNGAYGALMLRRVIDAAAGRWLPATI